MNLQTTGRHAVNPQATTTQEDLNSPASKDKFAVVCMSETLTLVKPGNTVQSRTCYSAPETTNY